MVIIAVVESPKPIPPAAAPTIGFYRYVPYYVVKIGSFVMFSLSLLFI